MLWPQVIEAELGAKLEVLADREADHHGAFHEVLMLLPLASQR